MMSLFSYQDTQKQKPPTTRLLRSAEGLTMPAVQVIVLNANMSCQDCRDRVSKVLSKIDNLLDYVVDVTQKKVTVRGRVDPRKRMQRIKLANHRKRKAIEFERLRGDGYSTDIDQQFCSNSDLLDYVVDVTQKKVTVRSRVDPRKRMHKIKLANDKKRKAIEFERLRDDGYSTYIEEQFCTVGREEINR